MLLGTGDAITEARPTANVAADTTAHFEIDPAALFAAIRAERAGGPALIGYYHSHPQGEAVPSATDTATAQGDLRVWIIVAQNHMRAWRMAGDRFLEVALYTA